MEFHIFVTPAGMYVEEGTVVFWDGMFMSEHCFQTPEAAERAVKDFEALFNTPPIGKAHLTKSGAEATDGNAKYHLWFSSKSPMHWVKCEPSTTDIERLKGYLEANGYQCASCCGWGCCDCGHRGYF